MFECPLQCRKSTEHNHCYTPNTNSTFKISIICSLYMPQVTLFVLTDIKLSKLSILFNSLRFVHWCFLTFRQTTE